MPKIVLATGNAGKLKELQQMLGDNGTEFITQKSLGISDVEETGLTFVENAIIKARHACAASGLPAIADDSGLEVDALHGEPGIYSARFAGLNATDSENNLKLLAHLQDVPDEQRSARFQCVIVFMRSPFDATPLICTGTWEGRILRAPSGVHGFGYDPLFYVPEHDCASAELDPAVKNLISHRGQALQSLMKRWNGVTQGILSE
jgi:XTP/dITP diphosphohydrolase